MNSRFLFKLTAIILTFFKLFIVAFPFSFALINLKQGKFKYGYDFFELDYKAAIVVTVGIALIFAAWNAFEFAKHSHVELKQYLKPKQKYQYNLTANQKPNQVMQNLAATLAANKRIQIIEENEFEVHFTKKNRTLLKDKIHVQALSNKLIIESKPKWRVWFIDMARNFRNVEWVVKRALS